MIHLSPLEGAFVAAMGDDFGTLIEVYPEHATLDIPTSDDQVVFGENTSPPSNWPFHVLLSVPLGQDEIERIGTREGWHARTSAAAWRARGRFFRSSSSGSRTG